MGLGALVEAEVADDVVDHRARAGQVMGLGRAEISKCADCLIGAYVDVAVVDGGEDQV